MYIANPYKRKKMLHDIKRKQEALNEVLLALLGSEQFVENWWHSPNMAFDYKEPIYAYIENPDRVAGYILSFAGQEGS